MADEKPDFISAMPNDMKPPSLVKRAPTPGLLHELKTEITKKRSIKRIVGWVLLVLALIVLAVQYLNAAKYQALVQVIAEDKIGVNPTGERLDFGDLPRDKDAVRTVSLESKGDTGAYVMIWKFGEIGDFLKPDKNYFTVQPHTQVKVEFTVHIPNSAEFKYYKGRVVIFQIPKIW